MVATGWGSGSGDSESGVESFGQCEGATAMVVSTSTAARETEFKSESGKVKTGKRCQFTYIISRQTQARLKREQVLVMR